jgi:hypothetical protein
MGSNKSSGRRIIGPRLADSAAPWNALATHSRANESPTHLTKMKVALSKIVSVPKTEVDRRIAEEKRVKKR